MFFRRSFQSHRRRGLFRIRRLLKRGLLLEEVGYVKQYQLSARLLVASACVARVRNGKGILGAWEARRSAREEGGLGRGSPSRGLAPQVPFFSLSNVCHALAMHPCWILPMLSSLSPRIPSVVEKFLFGGSPNLIAPLLLDVKWYGKPSCHMK